MSKLSEKTQIMITVDGWQRNLLANVVRRLVNEANPQGCKETSGPDKDRDLLPVYEQLLRDLEDCR